MQCIEKQPLVLTTFDSYGKRIYRLNYQLQTRVTTDFLNAIRDKDTLHKAADSLEVIKAFLSALQHANDTFATKYLDRTQEIGQKVEAEMESLIKETEVAYRAFINRLNAIVEIDDDGTYDNLVKDINAAIEQYNQVVIDRRGVKTTEPDTNEAFIEEFTAE